MSSRTGNSASWTVRCRDESGPDLGPDPDDAASMDDLRMVGVRGSGGVEQSASPVEVNVPARSARTCTVRSPNDLKSDSPTSVDAEEQ